MVSVLLVATFGVVLYQAAHFHLGVNMAFTAAAGLQSFLALAGAVKNKRVPFVWQDPDEPVQL